jgi:hypothetical protein
MEAAEKVEEHVARPEDLRAVPRYGVEEDAHLLLLKSGSIVPCRILDLSLGGCRVHILERLPVESTMAVEVNFKVKGLPFRFSGTIQWTDCRHLAGVRFVSVPNRRKAELVETLSEAKAVIEAEKVTRASEPVSVQQTEPPCPAAEQPAVPKALEAKVAPPSELETPAPSLTQTSIQAPAQAVTAQTSVQASAKPNMRERREACREAVDTSAVIDLIRIASRLPGRILDLSLSGCRIRTDEPFPVGIYTRIEVEFRLDGLAFRLGGVIQGIHDRRTVGIRFLDMSSRKREQVEQLMEEIREKKEAESRE